SRRTCLRGRRVAVVGGERRRIRVRMGSPVFFFSGRRRHTRFSRDWSADVCSSDLLRKLCRGLIELKRAELTEDRDAAIAAEFELVQVAREQPEWAVGWYGLGMSRLALARARVIAKESLEQLSGMSFEAGAGNALVRALRVEPTFTPALAALARIAIPREGAPVLGSRLATLRRHRSSLGPL